MNKKTLIVTLLLTVAILSSAFSKNQVTEKWKVTDIEFLSKNSLTNPLDVNFGAIFLHEDGMKMDVPGFWNGNRSWIVRFSPPLEGKWTYTTSSEVPNLSGIKGTVNVSPSRNQHGPIAICKKNPQRFTYADGTPYFPLAFEIDWLFALDAENPVGIPRTQQIVSELTRHRFNKAIMNVYAYDARWGEREKIDPKYNFSKPKGFPFGGTNDNPDHSTLNTDFFKHLDRVIDHLNEQGIVAHLMIYVWNKAVNWPQPGSDADNMYFDYVIKRYQAYPNLIWDISKEALDYGMDDMHYIISRIHRLKKLDGHGRLLTVHDYKFCSQNSSLVDFISIQEWRPNIYNEMIEAARKHSSKPVFNVEHGGYEKTMHNIFHGAYVDPVVCLERSYTCIFAGTYTTYYWQNSSWYELVYNPFDLEENLRPKFVYYKIFMEFFDQFNFNEMVPKQYVFSPYCLTDNKKHFIYLIPQSMYSLEGRSPKEAQGKNVEMCWFNPLTGEYTPKEYRKLGEWTGIIKPQSMSESFSLFIIKVLD